MMNEIFIPHLYLSNELLCTLNEDHMKTLRPWEAGVPTTPIEAQMTFGISSSGVRVLDFLHVKKAYISSL